MKLEYTTAIRFFVFDMADGPDGPERIVKAITSKFNGKEVDVFWCEWRGEHGREVFEAQSLNVSETATVRMPYIPTIYDALKNSDVYIGKNGAVVHDSDKGRLRGDNTDIYVLWGGVDNYLEANKMMEFKVSRYTRKGA